MRWRGSYPSGPRKRCGFMSGRNWALTTRSCPSALVAAGASLVTFAVGALIPLSPFLLGFSSLAAAVILAAITKIVGGGIVARITDRPFWRGGLHQLALAAVAWGPAVEVAALRSGDRKRCRRGAR